LQEIKINNNNGINRFIIAILQSSSPKCLETKVAYVVAV